MDTNPAHAFEDAQCDVKRPEVVDLFCPNAAAIGPVPQNVFRPAERNDADMMSFAEQHDTFGDRAPKMLEPVAAVAVQARQLDRRLFAQCRKALLLVSHLPTQIIEVLERLPAAEMMPDCFTCNRQRQERSSAQIPGSRFRPCA